MSYSTWHRLEVETTRAILCVGEWCKEGVVKDKDVLVAVKDVSDDVEDVDEELGDGWDSIV